MCSDTEAYRDLYIELPDALAGHLVAMHSF